MYVPFFDLLRQYAELKIEIFAKFEEVGNKTAFSGEPFIEKAETIIVNRFKREINNSKITFQKEQANSQSVHHLMVITTNYNLELENHLKSLKIGFAYHYPVPCHLQKAYSFLNYKEGDFPNSEYFANHCISLPMFPEMKNEEVDSVINAMYSF